MTVKHEVSRCSWLVASFVLLLRLFPISASPLSSCIGNSTTLDWYIDAVGETPCATYQKLRQICNSDYQTPSWPINTPTDQCDDPLSTCCCNSVAWSVRMLCINCQWDTYGTSDPGHSASAGAFYDYRWSSGIPNEGSYCGDGWNQTLPESVQLAVCQNGVQLEDFLYSIFWADGSWDFPAFEQSAQAILASQTKPISPCQNTTQSATSTSVPTTQSATSTSVRTTQTTTSTSAPTTSGGSQTPEAPVGGKVDVAAAIGGSLGGALGLVVLGAIIMILRYRKRLRAVPMHDSHDLSQNRVGSMYENIVTPFSGQYRAVSSSGNVPKGTPIPRTYDEEVLHPHGSYAVPTASVPEFEEGEDSPPVPLATSAFGPGSQLREHDAGVTVYADSHRHSSLPPAYRTVYSG